MCCSACVRHRDPNSQSRCCSSNTTWSITALAGAAIFTLGILFVVSVSTGQLGSLRNLMLKAAKTMGTTPIVLPILLSSVGGTLFLAAILGYANNRCTKSNHSSFMHEEGEG